MGSVMKTINVQLLGAPQIERDGKPVTVNTRKAIALIAYLVITAQPHSRESLVALLWPELDHRRGRAALRTTLSALKKALGGTGLIVEREAIGLDLAFIECDALQFAALLEHAENESCPQRLPHLAQAAALYGSDFMAGFSLTNSAAFDEWQRFQADNWQRQLSRVLSQLARCYAAEGQSDRAIACAQRWLALDPLHEPAHRQLMQLYATHGQRTAALRQHQTCQRVLTEELGVAPDAETTALYTQIRDAGLAAATGTKRIKPATRPLPTTPLVGRATELAQIWQRLTDPDCRLLTLIGVGGMGKTRLALAVAHHYPDLFTDGCAFVSLAPVSDARFLTAAIADALGFSFYGRSAPQQQLLDYLRQKRLLLILDNFEHLLAGADLLPKIWSQAPHVQLLVTSRERLQLRGEWVMAVHGLSYPADGTAVSRQDHAAIQLFLQTARRLAADFSAEDNLEAIARICQLVDGLPLGIELAAAWVRALPGREIAAEIKTNLDFLATSLRDLPERHRSLRAVFDHSWNLLTATEQTAFRQLSVFRGGFDRAAATAVTGTKLAQISVLLDKSLLRGVGNGRYAIPEALRPYGAEKRHALPHEQQAIKIKHSRYFAGFLQQHQRDLKGGRQQEALAEISAEIENIRLAWQWAAAARDSASLDMAAESLFLFYEMRSNFQEGVAMFQMAAQALKTADSLISGQEQMTHDNQRLSARAKTLARQGRFCHRLGRYEEAQTLLQESLDIAQALATTAETQADIAFARNNLGYVAWSLSQYDQAQSFYRQSLDIYRQIDDKWGVARTLNNQAIIPQDLAKTQKLLQESRRIAQEMGDLWGMARALNNLGIVTDDPQETRRLYQECAAICQSIGDRFLITFPLTNLGHTARQSGEFAEAQQFYQESLAICREIGYRAGAARNLGHLGTAAYALGDYDAAEQYCREGLSICRTLGDQRGIGLLTYTLGLVAIARGRLNLAEEQCQTSLTVFREAGDQQGVAWPLLGLARLAYIRGEAALAREWGQESLSIFQEVGDKDGLARALTVLGITAVSLNETASAQKLLAEALTTSISCQAVPITLETLVGITALRLKQGRNQSAFILLNSVLNHAGAEQVTKDGAARLRSELVGAVGAEGETAVANQQKTVSLDEIVAAVWEEGLGADFVD